MELIFRNIQKEINNTIEENPYIKSYYDKICKELNCELSELAAVNLYIPSKYEDLDKCNLEWFFNQGHNKGKIKNILVGKDIGSFVTNPENEYETYMFGIETRIVTVTDIDGNKQKFVSELHENGIESIVYCSIKDTTIPKSVKTKITLICKHCGHKESMMIVYADLYRYIYNDNPGFIQDIFPYLTPSQREMIQSQTCQKCWDKMFSELEYNGTEI